MIPTPATPDQATADSTTSPDDSLADAPAARVSLHFLDKIVGAKWVKLP